MTASPDNPFHGNPSFHGGPSPFFDHPFFRENPPFFAHGHGPPPPPPHHGHGPPPPPPHHYHDPHFHHHYHGRFMCAPLRFMTTMASIVFAMFFASLVLRIVGLIFAVLLSPPVLFLCLVVALIGSQGWEEHPFSNFNANRFQRVFFGPGTYRRLRRFCGMTNNNRCGSGGGSGGGRRNRWCRRGPNNNNNNATAQEQQQAPPPPPRTIEDTTSENSSDGSVPFTHYQRAPVHRDETEERLTLALDVPGFASDNINVSTEGDDSCLVIEGSRTNRVGDTFYVQERFVLDEETYKLDTTRGNLSDGVLEITIQKRPKPQPRVISITTHKKPD
jgi:HSP20 family molecular chaperone IbpA